VPAASARSRWTCACGRAATAAPARPRRAVGPGRDPGCPRSPKSLSEPKGIAALARPVLSPQPQVAAQVASMSKGGPAPSASLARERRGGATAVPRRGRCRRLAPSAVALETRPSAAACVGHVVEQVLLANRRGFSGPRSRKSWKTRGRALPRKVGLGPLRDPAAGRAAHGPACEAIFLELVRPRKTISAITARDQQLGQRKVNTQLSVSVDRHS